MERAPHRHTHRHTHIHTAHTYTHTLTQRVDQAYITIFYNSCAWMERTLMIYIYFKDCDLEKKPGCDASQSDKSPLWDYISLLNRPDVLFTNRSCLCYSALLTTIAAHTTHTHTHTHIYIYIYIYICARTERERERERE